MNSLVLGATCVKGQLQTMSGEAGPACVREQLLSAAQFRPTINETATSCAE